MSPGRPAPYGRRRLSGSAALTTEGDGWSRHGLRREPETTGPFGMEIDAYGRQPTSERMAKAAVEIVKRASA